MKRIVIIGGGTGTATLLTGLRKFPVENAVIISTADDGGSTGRLRRELGVIPPGDIRQCLVALSYTNKLLKQLFTYRFERGSLKGHAVGNIVIAALEKISGDIMAAIRESGKLLNVRGEVVPVTRVPTKLTAYLEGGGKIIGEHQIDMPEKHSRIRIKKLALTPSGPANPRAIKIIKQADIIVIGPGDLYTSTLPSLLVRGVAPAIRHSRAKKVFITNLLTEPGVTEGFTASRFVEVTEHYLGKDVIDAIIVNTGKPPISSGRGRLIMPDLKTLRARGLRVIDRPLIARTIFKKIVADPLRRSHLRHDPEKLARIIFELVR